MLENFQSSNASSHQYEQLLQQIASMNTLEFLTTILPEHGIHYLALFKEGYKVPAHKVYTDLETMAGAIDDMAKSKQLSVYHACASYQKAVIEIKDCDKRKYRTPENWDRAKSFWVDIDCGEEKHAKGDGYLTKPEAAKAIFEFSDTIGWPRPMIVDSGNGIHAYWPLTKNISHTNWVKIARGLKATLAHCNVLADPTRTADFASILRPMGSVNRKNGDAKPVYVVCRGTPVEPAALATSLETYIGLHNIKLGKQTWNGSCPGINDDLISHLKGVEGQESIELVRAALRYIDPGISRNHWRSMVWAIRHGLGDTPEALELADQWSKGVLDV